MKSNVMLLSLLTFLFSLEEVYSILSLGMRRTHTNKTLDTYFINSDKQAIYTDTFTFYLFLRFKTYFYPSVPFVYSMSQERTLFVVRDDLNINKLNLSLIYNTSGFVFFNLIVDNKIQFSEGPANLNNSLYDWYFLSFSHKKGNLWIYLENYSQNKILSSFQIKSITPNVKDNDLVVINPNKLNLNLETAFFQMNKSDALDFYKDPMYKLSFKPPIDCDAHCSDCNSKTGKCNTCLSGSPDSNGKCPPHYARIVDYFYSDGLTYKPTSDFSLAARMNQNNAFYSREYSISFWYRYMNRNFTYKDTNPEEIFKISSPDQAAIRDSFVAGNFPLRILRIRSARLLYFDKRGVYYLIGYPDRETWYFISLAFNTNNNTVLSYMVDICNKDSIHSFYEHQLPYQIEPISELIQVGFSNSGPLNPNYGIIRDFRLHYNTRLSYLDMYGIFSKFFLI